MMFELISSSSKVECFLSFLGDLEFLSNILPQQGTGCGNTKDIWFFHHPGISRPDVIMSSC
jgi:hypothetical protein